MYFFFSFIGSLERMLSNHIQSMFEYLAPRRGVGGGHGPGGGGVGGQGGQGNQGQGGHGAPNPGRQGQNEGYKDMVY
jgi:hypothetical protein